MKIIKANEQKHFFDAIKIRTNVFISEQKIDANLEIDEIDNYANHLIVYDNNIACATCRFFIKNDIAYIGRLAVLKAYRNKGIASLLLRECEKYLYPNYNKIHLHAQISVSEFYKKNGYQEHGNIFDDAGIKHILMIKELS